MDLIPRRRVARRGVLVLGGGFAGRHLARELGEQGMTIVEPISGRLRCMWPEIELVLGSAVALDPERRLVHVEAGSGRVAFAYAQLVIALGRFRDSVTTLGLPSDAQGRIRVDDSLRIVGALNIWALGDCAELPNGAPHESAPPALATFYG